MSAPPDSLAVASRQPALSLPSVSSLARALPWLTAAIALGVGLALIDNLPVGVMWDDGMYVILARALATGQGYHWINLPGAPAATHFPPGYPALLAALWPLAPSVAARVALFKLVNACFLALIAFAASRLVRERCRFGPLAAAGFALAATLDIPMLSLDVVVMSEPFFLVLLLGALLWAERLVDEHVNAPWRLAALGALAGLVTLVRSQGLALVGAVPAVLLLRRRRRDAALCLASSLLTIAPWQLWVAAHAGALPEVLRGSYGSYTSWLLDGVRAQGIGVIGRAALRTSASLTAMFATFAAPGMPTVVWATALLVLVPLTVLGARALRRDAPVAASFLLLYLAIVIVWPFPPARFVWGVWPLVLLVPVVGARVLRAWRPSSASVRGLRHAALAGAVLVGIGHLDYTMRGYAGRWWASIPRSSALQLRPLVLWARTTPPDAVLGVESESAVFLYAGRTAVPIQTFTATEFLRSRGTAENAAVIRAVVAAYRVRAIAVSGPVTREAARLLATEQPPELVVRDTFPGGVVLVPRTR